MEQDGVESGVAQEDLDHALGGGILPENGVDLLLDSPEHLPGIIARGAAAPSTNRDRRQQAEPRRHDSAGTAGRGATRRGPFRVPSYSAATNCTETGDETTMFAPVGVRPPFMGSTRNTVTLFESWLAANRYCPEGSMLKLRGVRPPLATCPAGVSLPVVASILKIAMSFASPRFEA